MLQPRPNHQEEPVICTLFSQGISCFTQNLRFLGSISSNFGTVDQYAHQLVARISLVYLLSFNKPASLQSDAFQKFPLLQYAAQFWHKHIRVGAIEVGGMPEHAQ